jgi:hypothetical protein
MLHVVGSLQLLLVQSSLRCGTSNEKKSDARSAATSNAKISMSGSGRPALSSSGTAMSERWEAVHAHVQVSTQYYYTVR